MLTKEATSEFLATIKADVSTALKLYSSSLIFVVLILYTIAYNYSTQQTLNKKLFPLQHSDEVLTSDLQQYWKYTILHGNEYYYSHLQAYLTLARNTLAAAREINDRDTFKQAQVLVGNLERRQHFWNAIHYKMTVTKDVNQLDVPTLSSLVFLMEADSQVLYNWNGRAGQLSPSGPTEDAVIDVDKILNYARLSSAQTIRYVSFKTFSIKKDAGQTEFPECSPANFKEMEDALNTENLSPKFANFTTLDDLQKWINALTDQQANFLMQSTITIPILNLSVPFVALSAVGCLFTYCILGYVQWILLSRIKDCRRHLRLTFRKDPYLCYGILSSFPFSSKDAAYNRVLRWVWPLLPCLVGILTTFVYYSFYGQEWSFYVIMGFKILAFLFAALWSSRLNKRIQFIVCAGFPREIFKA